MKHNCSYTSIVDVHKLQPNPRNPNSHPERQIEMLAKIIDYQGQRSPIVVSNRSGFIVKGHGRLAAIQKLGWDKAAVDYQDYDSEAQEYADLIADNKIAELAKHDDSMMIDGIRELDIDDLELLGLDGFELPIDVDEAKEEIEEEIEDDIPDNVETRCKPGDLWLLGEHRLLCGDSTDVLMVEKLMDGQKADMVFTDPPYGIDVVKGTVGGEKAFGSVVASNKIKANTYKPIANDDSTDVAKDVYNLFLDVPIQIYWGGNYFTDFMPPSKGWVVWDKKGRDWDDNFSDFEMAWTNQDVPAKIFSHTWMGMVQSGKREKRVHPTQKPTELAKWCFEKFGDPKSVVDLFGGSGSTLIACEKTNRKCFMMELDPHYCDVILSRWEKYSGKEAKLGNNG